MGNWYLFALLTVAFLFPIEISTELVPVAHAQTAITVPESTPCFLNYTAGANMWDNCNFEDDFLSSALLPFEYVTGGHFSLILVSIFILFTYVKYHNMMYPMLIGILFLPVSFVVFPDVFIMYGVMFFGLAIGIAIYYAYVRQTKEY